jgi:hypothetical protein
MIIATKGKYIHYLSHCYVGKTHDYSLLKTEFPPQNDWFSDHKVRVDLGYQGFEKDYKCKNVIRLVAVKKCIILRKKSNAIRNKVNKNRTTMAFNNGPTPLS